MIAGQKAFYYPLNSAEIACSLPSSTHCFSPFLSHAPLFSLMLCSYLKAERGEKDGQKE